MLNFPFPRENVAAALFFDKRPARLRGEQHSELDPEPHPIRKYAPV